MRFSQFVSLFTGVSLLLICSCEKHRLGEMPEEQKEQVELARKGKKGPASEEAKSDARGPSPTPADFFPEKKNP